MHVDREKEKIMARGRPPKPTAIKILHGDREDRINRNAPVPGMRPVEPPGWLADGPRAVWDGIGPDMIRKGVLTHWDVPTFAQLCVAIFLANAAAAQLVDAGVGDPIFREWRQLVDTINALGSKFGMSPVERSRLTIEPDPKPTSGPERLFTPGAG